MTPLDANSFCFLLVRCKFGFHAGLVFYVGLTLTFVLVLVECDLVLALVSILIAFGFGLFWLGFDFDFDLIRFDAIRLKVFDDYYQYYYSTTIVLLLLPYFQSVKPIFFGLALHSTRQVI